jgi:hypothetical protein
LSEFASLSEAIPVNINVLEMMRAEAKFDRCANAGCILVLVSCFLMTLVTADCNDGTGSQVDERATPAPAPGMQATPPSAGTPIRGAVGSFSDAHDFLGFAFTLEQAIGARDAKFFLTNTAFTDCSSNPCQAAGPAPQGQVLPLGVYQSEVRYLTRADYERFLLDFMTNTGMAPDSVGGVEPKLFAYAVPKSETVFEPLRNAEVVEAIVTKVSGPLPPDPQVPGLPNARQILSFGTTYRDGKWSVVFIRILPSDLFLNPTQSDVSSMYDFWQSWGP